MPHIIILAAGRGTRMRSELPKVLHPLNSLPMIEHVVRAVEDICERPTIVVGHRAEDVVRALGPEHRYVLQREQRGTGHAVGCALEALAGAPDESIVVIPGDHPFITDASIRRLVAARELENAALTLATARLPDFEGMHEQFYECGRIIRTPQDEISGIVEQEDASEEQKRVTEVNVSTYCFRGDWLKQNISKIAAENAAGEYYLTELVAKAFLQRERILGIPLENVREGMGINTPEHLLAAAG